MGSLFVFVCDKVVSKKPQKCLLFQTSFITVVNKAIGLDLQAQLLWNTLVHGLCCNYDDMTVQLSKATVL